MAGYKKVLEMILSGYTVGQIQTDCGLTMSKLRLILRGSRFRGIRGLGLAEVGGCNGRS